MLFYAMSRRRVSCPQVTQQLWDAIKTIRYQRQVPDIDRIARFMSRVHNLGLEEVTRQLNYCVRDGLLHLTKRVGFKGSKIGVETEGYKLPSIDKVEKDSHDWYCFECHRGGDVISCNTCHRVFHLACIAKEELPETDVKHKFVCNVCKMIDSKDVDFDIKKSQLNRLLRLTLRRLKKRLPMSLTERHVLCNASATPFVYERLGSIRRPPSELPSTIKWVNEDKDLWRQHYLLYQPMDLQIMEDKAKARKYEHLEEFKADAQTIVHNVVIYHGVHSVVADHARLMLRDCVCDLQEIYQCRDCYKISFDKNIKNWFCKPCRPPHTLVYAKQKGFPYWPAKVMKIKGDTYDVRLFGGEHQRTSVDKAYIRPISININTLQVKRTSSWNKACEELKRHQDMLEKMRLATNNFTEPSSDSSTDESDDESSVKDSLTSSAKVSEDKEDSKGTETSDISDQSNDDDENDKESAPLEKRMKDDVSEEGPESPVKKKFKKCLRKIVPISTPSGKRRPGRPPGRKSTLMKANVDKSSDSTLDGLQKKRRGRPPGSKNKSSLKKDQMVELQRKLEKQFEEKKRMHEEEKQRALLTEEESKSSKSEESPKDDRSDESSSPTEEEKVESSSREDSIILEKKEEEEMVSSSCQDPQVCSVSVQTMPLSPSPSVEEEDALRSIDLREEEMGRVRDQIIEEKNLEIARLKEEHIAEIAALEEKHNTLVTEIKKKQWCYNCECEAIYLCCWNTAYCSIDCQQLHWQKEHKTVCRRKR